MLKTSGNMIDLWSFNSVVDFRWPSIVFHLRISSGTRNSSCVQNPRRISSCRRRGGSDTCRILWHLVASLDITCNIRCNRDCDGFVGFWLILCFVHRVQVKHVAVQGSEVMLDLQDHRCTLDILGSPFSGHTARSHSLIWLIQFLSCNVSSTFFNFMTQNFANSLFSWSTCRLLGWGVGKDKETFKTRRDTSCGSIVCCLQRRGAPFAALGRMWEPRCGLKKRFAKGQRSHLKHVKHVKHVMCLKSTPASRVVTSPKVGLAHPHVLRACEGIALCGGPALFQDVPRCSPFCSKALQPSLQVWIEVSWGKLASLMFHHLLTVQSAKSVVKARAAWLLLTFFFCSMQLASARIPIQIIQIIHFYPFLVSVTGWWPGGHTWPYVAIRGAVLCDGKACSMGLGRRHVEPPRTARTATDRHCSKV